jgi:hypothetical protein
MKTIYKEYINEAEIEKHKIDDKTISLEIAKSRVAWWLETAAGMPQFKDNPKDIPRAIFISMDDIDQLKSAAPTAVGIRVYFGLKGGLKPLNPTVADLDGLIIAVLPKLNGSVDPIENDTAGTTTLSVYDFTSPCPPVCNLISELYVPYPTPD